MILLECTFICSAVTFVQPYLERVNKVQYWQKGMLYGGSCIIIAILHFSISQIGWVLVAFADATLYAFISLGKKASRDEMMGNARGVENTQSNVNYENFD